MDDNKSIPYIAHESMMARLERSIERLWILAIILVFLLVGTNLAWIYYENQFMDTETTMVEQEVDTGQGDATVTGTGDINYGESKTNGDQN